MAPLSKSRKLLFIFLSILLAFVFIFIVGEIATRIYYATQTEPKPVPPYDYSEKSEIFGWLTKGNYHYKGDMMDKARNKYPIEVTTANNGFRTYGDPAVQNRKKVFFIGDSYTLAAEVSNPKTYYNLLSDSLGFECFAYGSAGFGNLQEYLVLEKYLQEIKPDVVVWQLCPNDFLDNYFQLEINSNYQVKEVRPYLNLKEEIIYVNPVPPIDSIRKYSNFVYFIGSYLHNIRKNHPTGNAHQLIAEKGRDYPYFDHSVKVSDLIYRKFRKLISPQTGLLAFVSSQTQPQFDTFEKLCKTNSIPFVRGVPFEVKRAKKNGQVVNSFDGYHWNEAGHRIVAKALMVDLRYLLEGD